MSVVPSIIVLVITTLVVFCRELTALWPRQLRSLHPSLRELSGVEPGSRRVRHFDGLPTILAEPVRRAAGEKAGIIFITENGGNVNGRTINGPMRLAPIPVRRCPSCPSRCQLHHRSVRRQRLSL